ncbi:hypothetical_protein [Candidozyma auris]|uniref:hypothetical_protein n=1 Tax=Candidozyma auris TaxID=498019 RepID=UPI000D276F56|nr:hypothetical_protein [[Candida] auris]QEO22031.1 hypothetical_protein [[Candida] auris]GBL51561.1 hypothetical protein CAJCM15448_38350 [[Candida] auris]
MALGVCTVCSEQNAKYRCSKCPVVYCSLSCFKSPTHTHEQIEEATKKEVTTQKKESDTENEQSKSKSLHQKIAEDPIIQQLLRYKSLQVHIAVLLKILNDSSITNEPLAENRREIANMRLCNLRMGGSEENELVEEFVSRVIELCS